MQEDLFDPYGNNVLIRSLGPVLSREEKLAGLIEQPKMPTNILEAERSKRILFLLNLQSLHIPAMVNAWVADSLDMMIRHRYSYRDPQSPETIASITGSLLPPVRKPLPPCACSVVGPSGCGKTEAIRRSLQLYPHQVVEHANLGPFLTPHRQVVWLSVDAPASGRAEDLARALMTEWDRVTSGTRFSQQLSKERFRNPTQALNEWTQVATTHFLGILHIDEVQNFFKLRTKQDRRSKTRDPSVADLSIAEDNCLKWILTSLNSWPWPTVFSGTPDGMGALGHRLATLQRLNLVGNHQFSSFNDHKDPAFSVSFMGALSRYQLTRNKLLIDDAFNKRILELSGGIPRIIIALWISANRLALERSDETLKLSDFEDASQTYLLPLSPAIDALRSNDPRRLARYEDMIGDHSVWNQFSLKSTL